MSRHSSLDELRGLVDLLKPRDIHPCVEDPMKLTYLDLPGCFGDLIDLTESVYVQHHETVSKVKAEYALKRVLEERWAYDDISEDENEEESDSISRDDEVEQAALFARGAETVRTADGVGVDDVAGVDVENDMTQVTQESFRETTDNESDNNGIQSTPDPDEPSQLSPPPNSQEYVSHALASQTSDTFIYRDGDIANEDLIRYYFELAQSGHHIPLKSVNPQQTHETTL